MSSSYHSHLDKIRAQNYATIYQEYTNNINDNVNTNCSRIQQTHHQTPTYCHNHHSHNHHSHNHHSHNQHNHNHHNHNHNHIGPTGPIGYRGHTGCRGPTGKVGYRGHTGQTGPSGPEGPTGGSGSGSGSGSTKGSDVEPSDIQVPPIHPTTIILPKISKSLQNHHHVRFRVPYNESLVIMHLVHLSLVLGVAATDTAAQAQRLRCSLILPPRSA